MSIKLRNGAEFLHIPKTGGEWVTYILEINNLIESSLHKHADFDYNLFSNSNSIKKHLIKAYELWRDRWIYRKLLNIPVERSSPFRFCFVRHPIAWYESWWRYMEGRGWDYFGKTNSATHWHPSAILNGLGSSDFNEFIWNVIRKRPGYVSELFFSYTKAGISFIGKTESLRQDLFEVLSLISLAVDKSHLLTSSKKNESEKVSIEWDPSLKENLIKLELPALVHFGYLTEAEQLKLGINKYISPNKSVYKRNTQIAMQKTEFA